jgi:hypothetical protein
MDVSNFLLINKLFAVALFLTEHISDLQRLNLLNANKQSSRSATRNMNTKYFVVVTAMAVMLIGVTAFATDSAFAGGKKKYEKNQAVAQANVYGNGKLPTNVFCDNQTSQVQGDENEVALAGSQSAGESDD